MKTNYHTHTTFCDGKNSVEEMVLSAIEKEIDILGFSSHSMYPYASIEHIAPREFLNYVKEVKDCAKKYQDKLKIFLGFEVEYFQDLVIPKMSDYEQFGTDFLIGSVHYLRTQNGRFIVDGSVENVAKGIDEHFAGNGKKAVLEYFQAEREMLLHGDFQILGHPDLIRKTNGHLNFFTENDDWYKNELRACAESAKKAGVVVEINTGGMARSYIDTTYPSPYFLSMLFEKGVPVMINSDAHDAKNLDFAFEKAKDIARSIGYRELAFLESGTIKMQKF